MERKICTDINPGFKDVTFETCVDAIAAAGFDGIFTGWTPGDMARRADIIRGRGLYFQSVHSPFKRVHKIWEDCEEGDAVIDELIDCITECAEAGVPIVVIHPIIGMDKHDPTDLGIVRFRRLADEAQKLGIMLAFENVEGIEYLEKIIADLGEHPAVAFCWDTGHEMCYNNCMDVPAMYGSKLICTHLNDNLGQTDPNAVTWLDDSHLMPFDGVADWDGIAARLDRVNYAGELTFEMSYNSKPGKNTHDIYKELDIYAYFVKLHDRTVQFAQKLK